MKEIISSLLAKELKKDKNEIRNLIEIPPNKEFGDYSFPCFSLASEMKKNPTEIAKLVSEKIKSKDFEKIVSVGPYVNFFVNRSELAEKTLNIILKEKEKFGSSKSGKGKKVVIDMSSPNIAKPFGIGHLRSTIIGNSIANLASFNGFKPIKINYLGDWGTQFGKLILGYKIFGDDKKLAKDPINHMLDLYIKGNDEKNEEEARGWFKKLEEGNKEALLLWKKFKKYSLKDFEKIYSLLGIKFDEISGESVYSKKAEELVEELKKKNLLEESEGALIVNLDKYGLEKCLVKKTDGTTLYASRDLAAAIDRYKRYKFEKLIYEVGQEQTLHFKQIFKVLELMGYDWSKKCVHVSHGLYLGLDGKRFKTREGKTVFFEDILNQTIALAKEEISKREKLPEKELENRAKAIAIAAIVYGDLKNHRTSDIVFNIKRFLAFEGDTGPYLLYSFVRAKSILKKAKYKEKKFKIKEINNLEKNLINELAQFPDIVSKAYNNLCPNIIANYAYQLSQIFNEFYHANKVIGSDQEQFRLALVNAFSIVLKNTLRLLGISVIEKM